MYVRTYVCMRVYVRMYVGMYVRTYVLHCTVLYCTLLYCTTVLYLRKVETCSWGSKYTDYAWLLMLLGWYCCDIYWRVNWFHNCGRQTICMLCPSLAEVCVVITCRPCVWPEQAIMRRCDTCAACNLFWSHPDDDPAESKHAAVGMFSKTVVFDHYVIIYLFVLLFIIQT